MSPAIRVFLADDQALVRSGFRMLIESEDDLVVVGEASDGAATLRALSAQPVDVVLMDIRMPVMDGVEATRLIVQSGLGTRVLVLTTFDLDEYVFGALDAGARGFLLKDAGPELLVQALHAAASGDALIAPNVTVRVIEAFTKRNPPAAVRRPVEPLTEREEEVVRTVARGATNAEIAAELYISVSTVKTHLASLMIKLGARNRVELARWAYETGRVS